MSPMREMNESDQIFAPNDHFLRRIHPMYYNPATGKVSFAAFQNTTHTNRMSVNWVELSGIGETLRGYPAFGVASISAGLCWSLDQEIERTPVEDNPAHCDVIGDKPPAIRRKFRDMAEYLCYPSPA